MHLDCLASTSEFTDEELGHLLIALGFPRDLFANNLTSDLYRNGSIPTEALLNCCDLHYFNAQLHFTINLKSGSYNNEILKKSILMLTENFSFQDLQNVRLAFETYEEYDQKGMKLSEQTLLRTLKLCNRVISPKKLMNKLRHIQSSFKEHGRIQLYEFLDLLLLCEKLKVDNVESSSPRVHDKTWRDIYCVDNFRKFVMPKDKMTWKRLNEAYIKDELPYEQPTLHSEPFLEDPLSRNNFKNQVRVSNKEYLTIQRRLRESDKQIKLAKGGASHKQPRHKAPVPSSGKNKSIKSSITAASGITWNTQQQHSRASRSQRSPSTITAAQTSRSMPVATTLPSNERFKVNLRSASCPPVVNMQLRDEVVSRLNQLKFEMQTADQRWSKTVRAEMGKYLDNCDEVMRRMQMSRPVATRRRRRIRHQRPEESTITRLAKPKPMLPASHVTHCDAIAMGLGKDDHAAALQRHGSRHSPQTERRGQTRSHPRKHRRSHHRWNSLSDKKASLLERLLDDVKEEGIPLAEAPEDSDEDDITSCESGDDEHSLPADDQSVVEPENDVAHNPSPQPVKYEVKVRDHVQENMLLMDRDFSRIFLDCNKITDLKDDETPLDLPLHDFRGESFLRPLSGRSVESQTTEITEFEKFVGIPENLRIPDDVFIGSTKKSSSQLHQQRKSLQRIAGRFHGDEKSKANDLLKTKKSKIRRKKKAS